VQPRPPALLRAFAIASFVAFAQETLLLGRQALFPDVLVAGEERIDLRVPLRAAAVPLRGLENLGQELEVPCRR
jgi:hypothetical protein